MPCKEEQPEQMSAWSRMRGVRATIASARAADESDAADQALGRLIRETLDTRRGDGSGTQFRDDLVTATCPGTPERAYQDRLLDASILRLHGAMPAIRKLPVSNRQPMPRLFCGIDYTGPGWDGAKASL